MYCPASHIACTLPQGTAPANLPMLVSIPLGLIESVRRSVFVRHLARSGIKEKTKSATMADSTASIGLGERPLPRSQIRAGTAE